MNGAKMDNLASNMMTEATPPKVGAGRQISHSIRLTANRCRLDDLTAKSEVVLVVLRGWPGYQCPFCSRQAHDFVHHEKELMADGVQVVMVYPGPSDELKSHAADFLKDQDWPQDFLTRSRSGLFLHQSLWVALGCTAGDRLSCHVHHWQGR